MPSKAGEQERVVPIVNQAKRERVVIVGRDSLTTGLLATAVVQRLSYLAEAIRPSDLLKALKSRAAALVVLSADFNSISGAGFDLARAVSTEHPGTPIVILLEDVAHDLVIRAFRSGASGVFYLQDSIDEFIDCVDHARRGRIWAGKEATESLLEEIKSFPTLRSNSESDVSVLTERELQVVQCAAKGQTNKAIAGELHLSEHTVKNYLFRAFEKLGVSSRVELLFYLATHGYTFAPSNDYPEKHPVAETMDLDTALAVQFKEGILT